MDQNNLNMIVYSTYYHGKAIYKGEEFPDYIDELCSVYDDHTNPNNPCYMIIFDGTSEEINNIDDDDIEFL
jgi:hypothetical protein